MLFAAIALVFVGVPTLSAADQAPSGATEADIVAVAEEFGVSPQVAQSRLEFQARFSEVVNLIAVQVPSYVDSALSDDFATNSGTVLLADATKAEWQAAASLLAPLGDTVALKPARLTAAEEEKMFDTARDRLAWLEDCGRSIALGWAADIDRLTVVVGGSPVKLGQPEREMIQSDLSDLASDVTVRDGPEDFNEDCPTNPTKTGGVTEGGRMIAECGVNDCTAGFSVRLISNPARTGVLTAAHCNDFANDTDDWWYIRYADGTTPYSTVRYADHEDYDHGDIMFLREWFASVTPQPRVYMYGQLWQEIDSFQYENPRNAWVIAKGAQTANIFGHLWANMWGTIVDNTVEVATNGVMPDTNFRYAAVDYGDDSGTTWQLSPRSGDSGSPVYLARSTTALGIHKGGNPGWEIYSKIGYALQDMNLELLP